MSHVKSVMINLVISKGIHTSAARLRQRGIALKRYMRKRQAPFHKVRFIDCERDERLGEAVKYPDLIPDYPPGRWGTMSTDLAWKWHRRSQYLQKFKSNFERSRELYLREQNMWYHSLECPLNYPETCDFYQYISRTIISPNDPNVMTGDKIPIDDMMKLSEKLKILYAENAFDGSALRSSLIQDLMDCVYSWMLPYYDHLKDMHIDERADWETFIKRSGYDRLKELTTDPTIIDEENIVKYRIRTKAMWQMRHRNPLHPIFSDDSTSMDEQNLPQYNYHPQMFNLNPVDCHGISVHPLHKTFHSDEFLINKPGFWGDTPFYRGDPCQFGIVGVVKTSTPDFLKDIKCDEAMLKSILNRHHFGEGLMSAFTWASAQAWNQGFNFYDDVTYPFVSQLILTDGRVFRFMLYQLNSIAALSRGINSGLPMNVVWMSEPAYLYESVSECGDFENWNLDVIKQIVNTLSVKPMEIEDHSILRPHLDVPQQGKLINLLGERDWERQPSIRIKTQPRPHPNELYYKKMVNRSEILNDIRKTFPNIGKLPRKYEQLADEHRNRVLFEKGRQKTEAPPKKWR